MLNTVPDTKNTNPIFSSYSLRSADFNENMDEYIKAPYDLYIEEQKKKQPNKNNINLNINTDAIKSIPDMPSFLEEEYQQVYKMPEWFEKLNVCTSEEIEEWKKQGGMGIAEAWNKNRKWASFAPYINTTKDAADAITVSVLLNRAKKGEELSYEQQEKLVDYLRDMKELQTRGFTFGGGTVNAILTTIPYIEEFAIGLATSEAGVGLASLGKTLSSIGAKKAARKAVEKAIKDVAMKSATGATKKAISLSAAKKIYKDTLTKTTMSKALVNVGAKEAMKETAKALPKAIGSSAKFGLTKMPETFVGGVADRQIATGVYVTDMGDAIFTDSEHLALSIMKSLGDSTFEALTETAGWTFSPVMGFFAKPVQKLLPKKFFSGFEKLVSSRYGMPAAKALRKYGYDGIIEEMGEEVLNRFLCQTFGINGLDEYNFDGFMNNVLYANNPSQWGQEALSFAVAGAGGHIVAGSAPKIAEEWDKIQYKRNIAKITNKANKYIQSPEQFYLDQGLIKIKGSQSVAEQKLRNIWTSQNIDEGLQDDILKDMSETEIRNILKNNIENNNRPLTSEERIRQREIKNEVYEKLVNANVDEEQAQNLSILISSFFEKYARDEKSREMFDKFINNLSVKFNIPVENIDVLKTGISYNQAVESAGADENEISDAQIEWQEKGVESKYFKKWFGDSKVVDENGKPLIVYHGTNADFDVFDRTKTRANMDIQGNFFSPWEIDAKGYGENVRAFYLNIKNPADSTTAYKVLNKYQGQNNAGIKAREELEKMGYDGVNNDNEEYIAFYPEQIKSVNNRGTFDKNNPNIYFQGVEKKIKTIKDIFDKVPMFEPLREYFDDVMDVPVKEMPKWLQKEGKLGFYMHFTETIYLDYKKIARYPNDKQTLVRVFLHELLHAKQDYLKTYANKNKNNKNLTAEERKILKDYLALDKISNKDDRRYKFFQLKSLFKNVKNDKEFATLYKKYHNIYENEVKELDADNVALALQAYIGNTNNGLLLRYLEYMRRLDNLSQETTTNKEIAEIRSFNERNRNNHFGFGRLSNHVNTRIFYQPAYHGTPHRFDEFSVEKIGTGEGAQAHGWGLYFAENKDVSDNYRKTLAKVDEEYVVPVDAFYDGKKVSDNADFLLALETTKKSGKQEGIKQLKDEIEKCEHSIKSYNKEISEHKKLKNKIKFGKVETKRIIDGYTNTIQDLKEYIKEYNEQIKFIENLDLDKLEIEKRNEGQLFKVDVPENDELLDEDKKFSEQPEKVQNAIKKLFEEGGEKYQKKFKDIIKHDYTGKGIYKSIGAILLNNDELHLSKYSDTIAYADMLSSKKLNEYGIKGITYNGYQDGRCYVVFDDKAIKILQIYFQETNDNENLMAGYTPSEVMDKLSEIYNKIDEGTGKLSEPEMNNLWAQAHIIEDAFDTEVNPQKYSAEKLSDIMLNVYYIMNNQNIPQDYIDSDSKSKRTYNDLKTLHNEKKEEKEREYRGYFYKDYDAKPIVTIMENQNASTALHEFSHLFLDMLNELAKVNDDAKTQLEAVNKWLGSNGEYTVKQHEKFANNFVAYLYKGKAPNKKLKTVFENFKEWLKSVYNQIMDIPDVDISEEVQQLFDNMFMNDTFYQERKQVNDLIKQAKQKSRKERIKKKPVIIDNSSLDDAAKKHKEYCYEILSAATGKSEVYLKTIFETDSNKKSFGKKREAIENLLDKVDDKITTKIGFKPEWSEFFTDPGVSYENDDTEGDYKLVEQAFDTIISKSFGTKENAYNKNQNEYAEYIENAIDKANKEYEVLIRSYKNNDRDIATSAIFEWLDDLDEEIRQDYEDKFIYDSGIIERNENVDRFDKAKRQILQKAMDLGLNYSINENEKYQELVKQVMQSLNFLHPEDKAKMTANILDINSLSMLSASLDNIMDIAKTMEDTQLRKSLEKEIHKELQTTKNIKKNGRTVGKYDYKTNKLFEELRQLDRLSAEKANEYRLENARFAGFEENGATFREKLINKFLSYKADGKAFADTGLMKSLYDEIIKIKQAAKSAKSELDLEEKLTEEKDIDELINIVQNKKEAKFFTKAYVNMMGNLESTLNALFNKDIKERYGTEILYAETQSQAWQYEQKQNFEKEVARIYNLPQWLWDKKILEYLKETHTYPELRRKYDNKGELIKTRTIDRTLTKMDIIQAYIWSKNETLEKRLINQFGEETLYSMFDEMSIDDVRFAELMLRTAQSFYPLVNEAFINKYGLNLPKVSCYFPSTPERGSEVDLYNEYSQKSLNNSFTKARAMSETQPMDFHNPVTTLYSHIDGVAKFVFMSESLDKANLRFKNNDLKRVIINKYGDDAFRTLEQILMNTTYKKEAGVFNGINKVIDNMVGNWIQANVAIKPMVGLKQLLSVNNYAVDMPFMTWQMGFLKALANPKKTIDYMMKIPYLKARYGGSYSNEFLKQTVENSAFAASKKLKDLCNIFIRTGDIGAIIFGGKPYIDYLINEKKMSEDEAIKQFIISTNRSQQSSAISSLSNFQVAMTRNPMGKLFIAFKNSPQQYVRMCGDAIVSTANGDMSKTQCAQYLFQFGFLQPFFYAIATSGAIWRLLFTGDDDDLWNDLKMSIFNLGSDAVPILGDIYKYALNKMTGKGKYLPQTTPLLGDIENEINRLSKEDISAKDYFEAIGYLMLHVGLGYNSKAITNEFSGLGDIVTGEPVQGLMKVAGYTDKRAKHIVGND